MGKKPDVIYPLTLACARDAECLSLLVKSARALGDPRLAPWTALVDPDDSAFDDDLDLAIIERLPGFSPWSPRSAEVKLNAFLQVADHWQAGDSDYVLHVDSDCIFYSAEALGLLDGKADIVGPLHNKPVQVLGAPLAWCSGAFMGLRVDKLREVAHAVPVARALEIMRREGMGPEEMSHDDLVISVMFHAACAHFHDAQPLVRTGDLEAVTLGREIPPSLLHYGTDARTFLGVPNCPKWQFPEALATYKEGLCLKTSSRR
mgnify:CR=1 FL=1